MKEKIKIIITRIKTKFNDFKKRRESKTDREVTDEVDSKEIKHKMKTWKKVLICIGSSIGGLVTIIIVVYFALTITGKSSIYNKTDSEKPVLQTTEPEGETVGELNIDVNGDGSVIIGSDTSEDNSQTVIHLGESDEEASNTEEEITSQEMPDISFEGSGGDSGYDVIYNGEKYVYNDDMISLLLLGIDKYEAVEKAKDAASGGQADALYLLVLNPDTEVMDIIAIPRDSIALIDVYNPDGTLSATGYAQICLQHKYGDGMSLSNERTKNAVSKMLYNLPIHSVTSFNMGAIAKLNDIIGGITLTSLHDFEFEGYTFQKGKKVKLEGRQAYAYLRFRDTSRHYTAPERLERQKQYIDLFVDKAISELKKDIGLVTDVYDIICDYVVTDLAVNEMTYLASEIISYDFGQIYTLEGSISTKWTYERLYLNEAALVELLIDKFYEKVD